MTAVSNELASLGVVIEDGDLATTRLADLNLDSFGMVCLVLGIEESTGRQFDDVKLAGCMCVADLCGALS